jgi:hypothetical protein
MEEVSEYQVWKSGAAGTVTVVEVRVTPEMGVKVNVPCETSRVLE